MQVVILRAERLKCFLKAEVFEGSGQISLSVSDDGIGFNPQETVQSGHFGFIGMRERVTAVGGASP